jgi:hypothetical protein
MGETMDLLLKHVNILTVMEQQYQIMAHAVVDILVSQIVSHSFNKNSMVIDPAEPVVVDIPKLLYPIHST